MRDIAKADIVYEELNRVEKYLQLLTENKFYEKTYKREISFLQNYRFALTQGQDYYDEINFKLDMLAINADEMEKIEETVKEKKPVPKNNIADEVENYASVASFLGHVKLANFLEEAAYHTRSGKWKILLREEKQNLDDFKSFLANCKQHKQIQFTKELIDEIKYLCSAYYLKSRINKSYLGQDLQHKYLSLYAYIDGLEKHLNCKRIKCYLGQKCDVLNSYEDIVTYLNSDFRICKVEQNVVRVLDLLDDFNIPTFKNGNKSFRKLVKGIKDANNNKLNKSADVYYVAEINYLRNEVREITSIVDKYRAMDHLQIGQIVVMTKDFGADNGVLEKLNMKNKRVSGIITGKVTIDFGCKNYITLMNRSGNVTEYARRFIGVNILINDNEYFIPVKHISGGIYD